MAEQYVLEMEEGRMERDMPALRPFDLAEYGGIVRRHVPSRSIVHIPKFSGEDKEKILWIGWNSGTEPLWQMAGALMSKW